MTRFFEISPLRYFFWNSLALFWRFIWHLPKLTFFGKLFMLLGKFSLLQMAKHGSNNLAIWSHWTNNAGSVEIVEPFLFATVNGLVAIDKYFTKNMNSVSFSFLIFKICECFKSSKYHWFAFTERTMLTVFFKKICANPASFCLFHPFYQYNDKYSSRFAYIKAWMVSLEFEPGASMVCYGGSHLQC